MRKVAHSEKVVISLCDSILFESVVIIKRVFVTAFFCLNFNLIIIR